MKRIKSVLAMVFTLPLLAQTTFAADSHARYEIDSPAFPIAVNGSPLDNVHNPYPLFLYEGITYFPMTWSNTAALGLEVKWDQQKGLNITRQPACQPFSQNLQSAPVQLTSKQAVPPPFPVTVNGKIIRNAEEPYPILFLNDIVYFPMTWRFTNSEFNWQTAWDASEGYSIGACEEQTQEHTRKQEELAAHRNLLIGGNLASSGDWIFTNPFNHQPSLEKWSKDGATRIKLTDDNARSINVSGDWLYYTIDTGTYVDGVLQYGGIYKIRQDGTERTRLSAVSASQLAVDQDWIYFLETSDSGISRMKTDGSSTEKIIPEKGIHRFFISSQQLFFQQNETYDVFQTDLSGRGKKQADKHLFSNPLIVDGWIYHTKVVGDTDGIYKTSLDGSTSIQLYTVNVWDSSGQLSSLQYRDGWIYFLQGKISHGSHIDVTKIRIDGTGYSKHATVGYGRELYSVDPHWYVIQFTPFSTEEHLTRVTEDMAP
ncbi:DUF5050 domain-containing protein [Paenibacillus mucilaginosus]|uniref:Prolow-density lipoprotein receptor-related protein 1-like beta-propeller domain-containing protein n=1 Tax=Paenibacillus mucilaginosus (strain KNP414) TaxID=1036673 RepID=F8FD57_PAEMK|nr:DUF5050 domain-containing protein [Paenibacillus mucilaginosus]AEI41717.1 hypothetical protein KNP414_03159 [Paenibacillus mucilaginosus KNP414]MCG7214409.1 DUF5050 domain-containing protein [Paenibacillus mucilaginosus]WDM30694.1 DUF5050 domain-containing protein [Paenibacillus mucilaginosus]